MLREHSGYQELDRVELGNMEKIRWTRKLFTDLTPREKTNMGRAHMLRYAKFTSICGLRRLSKLKKQASV